MPKETLRCEYIRCGKKCGGCPHGPYWYAYWKEGGRTRKRYIGKLKDSPPPPTVANELDDIFDRSKASAELAKRIMGIQGRIDGPLLKGVYRRLMLGHHPDRGGDLAHSKRIQAAFSYLKATLGM